MKLKKILLSGILFLSLMSSCSPGGEPADATAADEQASETEGTVITTEATTVATEETTAETTKKAPETPEEFRAAMIEASLVQLGNTYRLEQKLAQMSNGDKTTVAYIGGSITQMYNATAEDCYAMLSYKYLADSYGTGENVEYVNAGLSGTPSSLGVLRAGRDITAHNSDIVFIEFAVNDSTDDRDKESYESLVRTILSQDNEPAVILLFMVDEKGYSAQNHMKQIGEHYSLPMISVPDALNPEWDAGRMTWADYSDDYIHPHVEGHALVAEFIAYYFETLNERDYSDTSYALADDTVFGRAFENSILVEKNNMDAYPEDFTLADAGTFNQDASGAGLFSSGWSNERVAEGKEPMKFTVTANAVSVVYKRNKYDVMGTVDVYVDGEKVTSVNSMNPGGFGEAQSQTLIKLDEVKAMEIEIRMAEGSEDKMFEILGIAFSQN